MASRYYYGAILAATLATSLSTSTYAVEEIAPLEEVARADRELGGWGSSSWGGWGPPSSSSSSGKSGKSGGSSSSSSSSHDYWGPPPSWGGWHSSSSSSSGKSGKSGGSSSSSSSSSDWWGKPPAWGWGKPSSSSSSGKSGKSGGGSGKSGKSGGSSSSSSWSHDMWGPPPSSWGHSSSSSSGKSGKSGGGKSGKSSSSSSGDPWGKPWGGWGKPSWGKPSSSSSSGKSGKSKGSKSKGSKSSSSSSGEWVWVEGWGDWGSSSSSSGKSGKSGGSGSGKSGKSGGSSGSESIDVGKWADDGWTDDGWGSADKPPVEQIYSKGGVVGGWKADGWDNDGHYKADMDYVRAEVRKLIEESERELIPKFLRMGFHDCVGGCDGCIDLTNPDNKGLREPIEALHPIYKKFEHSYSKADIWALATLVSADMAVLKDRPQGLHFPMRYIGRKDCDSADEMGIGGPDVEMPSNDLDTHGLLKFFKDNFGYDTEETVVIMGVHATAIANRKNSGFGNIGKEDGWVFDAESYALDNRYYGMLDEDTNWELELVHNEDGIPSRYQWYHEKDGEDERPIMTNADMALVRDLSDHMYVDKDGNEGASDCSYMDEKKKEESTYTRRRNLQYKSKPACPIADDTIEFMMDYKMDNTKFLYKFEKVLEKMVKNGY